MHPGTGQPEEPAEIGPRDEVPRRPQNVCPDDVAAREGGLDVRVGAAARTLAQRPLRLVEDLRLHGSEPLDDLGRVVEGVGRQSLRRESATHGAERVHGDIIAADRETLRFGRRPTTMSFVSRGFQRPAPRRGRRSVPRPAGSVPDGRLPGALGRPDAAHAARRLDVHDRRRSTSAAAWTWEELVDLPSETVTVDIHCVTRWSKLDTSWQGVSVDTLLAEVEHDAPYVLAFCDGGYTTNLPLEDVTGGKAWVAYDYDGEPLEPEHGGPARLLVPHLYFWKSAKWVRGLELREDDEPGFWETYGYHIYGDPWREQRYAGD